MAGGWDEKHMPEAPASIVSDEVLVATKNPSWIIINHFQWNECFLKTLIF